MPIVQGLSGQHIKLFDLMAAKNDRHAMYLDDTKNGLGIYIVTRVTPTELEKKSKLDVSKYFNLYYYLSKEGSWVYKFEIEEYLPIVKAFIAGNYSEMYKGYETKLFLEKEDADVREFHKERYHVCNKTEEGIRYHYDTMLDERLIDSHLLPFEEFSELGFPEYGLRPEQKDYILW